MELITREAKHLFKNGKCGKKEGAKEMELCLSGGCCIFFPCSPALAISPIHYVLAVSHSVFCRLLLHSFLHVFLGMLWLLSGKMIIVQLCEIQAWEKYMVSAVQCGSCTKSEH